MLRTVGAVVAGYVVLAVVVMASFPLLHVLLGADRVYLPQRFAPSGLWIALTSAIGLGAAIAGGATCAAIAKSPAAIRALAALVLAFGILAAVFTMRMAPAEATVVRTPDTPMSVSMQQTRQPVWVSLLNPLIGAAGVLIGGRLRRV